MSIRKYKAGTVQPFINFIKEAAANGASLIAFSVWLPGCPNFLCGGNYLENIPLVHKYMQNSMGPEMVRIRQAAAENNIYVCLGFSERDGGSLCLSQVLTDSKGKILLHRRKLKPTHVERTLFGDSTGDSLSNVVDTPLDKIGMLNCWDHLQPLLKYNTYAQGEQVHIAAWPFNGKYLGLGEPRSVCNEANEVTASHMYALEGQTYVLVTNQCVSPESVKANSSGQKAAEGKFMLSGGGGNSGVFAPDGRKLTEDVDPLFDGLIYCDIDLDQIDIAKAIADPVGNYSRPDLLRLLVDDEPKHCRVKVKKNTVNNILVHPGPTLTSRFKKLEETLAELGISSQETQSQGDSDWTGGSHKE